MVISFMFILSTTSSMVLIGQGDPAMMPVLREEKSNLSNSLLFRMLMNIVGTPYTAVHFSVSMVVMTLMGSNTSTKHIVTPWLMHAITPRTHPKQWNSGTLRQRRSVGP